MSIEHPILFIDFDGVFHPDDVWMIPGQGIVLRNAGRRLFDRAPLLAATLACFPAWRVVLSTSWVRVHGYMNTMQRLPEAVQDRVIGATWHADLQQRDWLVWSRYQQIHHYARHHQVANWLALDDDTRGWPPKERHRLISPQPQVGLTPIDVELLVRRMRSIS